MLSGSARGHILQAQVIDLPRPAAVRDVRDRAVQLRAVEGGHRRRSTGSRGSVLWGQERGSRSCSMTRATSSPALPRPRRRCSPRCAMTRSPSHFFASASFSTAKRPFTKALLQRVDLAAIRVRSDRRSLTTRARDIQKHELGDLGPSRAISKAIVELEQQFNQVSRGAVAGAKTHAREGLRS